MDDQRQVAASIAGKMGSARDVEDLRRVFVEDLSSLAGRRIDEEEYPIGLPIPRPSQRRIGIWVSQITDEGESFVRSNEADPWQLWSKTQVIPPKGSKRRVVLIGESVARGCLYDPHFNCSQALQQLLNRATDSDQLEVVDLANKGMRYDQLTDTVEAALCLQPDAFVVFAGNNWKAPLGVRSDRIVESLSTAKGWRAVRNYVELLVRQSVKTLVGKLAEISALHAIPIVFVIPEFNLADWHSYSGWRSPLLVGDSSKQWHRLREVGQRAIQVRNYTEAIAAAQSMTALDGDGSPLPYEMLGKCYHECGDEAQARRFIEEAGNIALSLPVPKAPRCFAVTQSALRAECGAQRMATVDLPQAFQEFLGGGLPDRRLFLDYCHLTTDGIQLAMARTAERLLPLMGVRRHEALELSACPPAVERRVLAQAHFAAAIMNAHGGQGYEIVKFHFLKAVQHAQECVELGSLFADFSTRQAPATMCGTFARMMARRKDFPLVSFLAVDLPDRQKQLNVVLIQALRDAVAEKDVNVACQIERVLLEAHSLRHRPQKLLRRTYCDMTMVCVEDQWWERCGYLQAREPASRFHLICEKPCPVEVRLTCRVHYPSAEYQAVSVAVNERFVGNFTASTRWSRRKITIPSINLNQGVNSLVVGWPEPEQTGADRVQEIAQTLKASDPVNAWFRVPDVYPIYGEIQDLSAVALPGRV